jgi:hypothetical protein
MRMRLKVGVVLATLAGPVGAETVPEPARCADLEAVVEAATGLELTAPAAASPDGWCVLDGARSALGDVRVSAENLRLRGAALDDGLVALEIEAAGLRVAPALNNRDMPEWVRDLLRLQSAEFRLALRRDEVGDRLLVERVQLVLSGGGELHLSGEVAGAELAMASLMTGRLTRLQVEWQNDGRTLRPVMEALGAKVQPGIEGTEAVLAARSVLQDLIAALPADSLPDDGRTALDAFVAALPQGRGRLVLDLASDNGIGAAQLGLVALSDDPTGAATLERVFAATKVTARWTPGLAP